MRDPPKYLEINSIMRFKYKLIAFKSSLSNCNEFKIESDQIDVTRTVHHIWRHNCIALCSLQKPVSYWDQMNVCCWPHTGWEFVIHFILSIATYFLLSFQQPRKCRSVKIPDLKSVSFHHSPHFIYNQGPFSLISHIFTIIPRGDLTKYAILGWRKNREMNFPIIFRKIEN